MCGRSESVDYRGSDVLRARRFIVLESNDFWDLKMEMEIIDVIVCNTSTSLNGGALAHITLSGNSRHITGNANVINDERLNANIDRDTIGT